MRREKVSFFFCTRRNTKREGEKAKKKKKKKTFSPCVSDKAPREDLRGQPSHAFRVYRPPRRGHRLCGSQRVEQRRRRRGRRSVRRSVGRRRGRLAVALYRLSGAPCVVDHRHAVPPRHELQGRPGPDERPAARLLPARDGLEQEARCVAVVGGDEAAVGEHGRQRVAEEPLVQRDEVGPALARGGRGGVDELLEGREARVVGRGELGEGSRGSCGVEVTFFCGVSVCVCERGRDEENEVKEVERGSRVDEKKKRARATTTPTTAKKTTAIDSLSYLLSSLNLPGAVGCGTAVVPLSLSLVNGRAGAETEERRAGMVRRGWCGGARAAAANFGDGAFAKEADEHDDDAVACEQALIATMCSLSIQKEKRKAGDEEVRVVPRLPIQKRSETKSKRLATSFFFFFFCVSLSSSQFSRKDLLPFFPFFS